MMGRNEAQLDFFTQYAYERLVPKDHELRRIRETIEMAFVRDLVKDLYCDDNGRPSWDPEVMIRALFVEFYADLSDRDLERELQVNLLYRWFCGLDLNSGTPDATALVVFRKRLGEERFEKIFDALVKACQERGMLVGKVRRVDATHVLADVASRNMVNQLRQAQHVLKRTVRTKDSALADELEKEFPDRGYLSQKGTEEELQEEAERTRKIVQRAKSGGQTEILTACTTLEGILRGDPGDAVSMVDPEARVGHKSAKHSFVGYKVHIAEDESEIITSLDVLSGNAHEGAELDALLEQEQQKGVTATAVVGDSLYESANNYQKVRDRGMQAIFAQRRDQKKATGFHYDEQRDVFVCAAEKESAYRTDRPNGAGAVYTYLQKDCMHCPLKEECIGEAKMKRQRVFLSLVEREARMREKDPQAQKILAERRNIERKFGEAKVRHGLRRARYRTRKRVAVQAWMTFLVINVSLAHVNWASMCGIVEPPCSGSWSHDVRDRGATHVRVRRATPG
ncbi:MAG: IS1182 family transposase [Bacillota bacterium]